MMDDKQRWLLKKYKIAFLGPIEDSKFGAGSTRKPITLEPYVEFRGGSFDIQSIGAFSYLGFRGSHYRHIDSIGRFCSFGPGVVTGPPEHNPQNVSSHSFLTGNWGKRWPELYSDFGITAGQIEDASVELAKATSKKTERIKIGNDVWIGDGVFISRGVTIGDGAVIAARATVVKDVLPYEIVGGTSAKRIRMRFSEKIVDRLLASRWWDYGLPILAGTKWTDVEATLDVIEERIAAGAVPWRPKKLRIHPDDRFEVIASE